MRDPRLQGPGKARRVDCVRRCQDRSGRSLGGRRLSAVPVLLGNAAAGEEERGKHRRAGEQFHSIPQTFLSETPLSRFGAARRARACSASLGSQSPALASICAAMATDSATMDRRTNARRRSPPPDAPPIASPAAPIARGIGLDQPFFADKNRAFWILQTIGWSGYFLLRSLSGFANSMSRIWLVHRLLLTATGYSLTLLM